MVLISYYLSVRSERLWVWLASCRSQPYLEGELHLAERHETQSQVSLPVNTVFLPSGDRLRQHIRHLLHKL